MPAGQAGAPVTVRYWAGARAAAGVDQDVLDELAEGARVGDVLAVLTSARPALGAVVAVSTVLLDGRVVGVEATVPGGAVLEVLPPFAGG